MAALERVSRELTASDHPSWGLVYSLLRLTLRLYGFGYDGAKCYSLAYWQTPEQRHTEELFEGGDSRWQNERADAVSLRRQVVEELSGKGIDDFKIALILNTSEYAVKQLRSNLRLKGARPLAAIFVQQALNAFLTMMGEIARRAEKRSVFRRMYLWVDRWVTPLCG